MSHDIVVSRKDIREALVRSALKDEEFRESLIANPKLAIERALGTTLPDNLEVELLQETENLMFIILPKEIPAKAEELSDADLEAIAGGFLGNTNNLLAEDRNGLM